MQPSRHARGARAPRLIALAVIGCALAVSTAGAQGGLGVLVGTVRSLDGTPVQGVQVTISNDEQSRTAVTDRDGDYRVENLLPGLASITVGGTDLVLVPELEVGVVRDITIRSDLVLRSPEEIARRTWTPAEFIEASPGLAAALFDGPQVRNGDQSLARILERVPGVSASRAGGIGHPWTLRMRGVDVGDQLVMTDGVRLAEMDYRLDTGDELPVETIEVVRGLPSSRRDGELTGIVHRLTRPVGAADTPMLTFDAEGGELGFRRAGATTAGTRGDYDWMLGGRYTEADNEQPNAAFEQTAAGGSLDLTRGAITAHVVVHGETSTLGHPGQTLLAPPDLDAGRERTQLVAGATLRLRPGGRGSHEMRLAASQSERLALNPVDSGSLLLQSSVEAARRLEVADQVTSAGLRNDLRSLRLTHEYAFEIDEFHYMTFGGSVEGESARFSRTDRYDQERLSGSLYAEDRIQLFPDLLLTAGGRFTKNGPFDFQAMPRGSLTYELGWGFLARAAGGYGVGTPTLAQRFGETFEWRGTEDLVQAVSRTIDAGIVGAIWGGRVRLDIAGYWHEYEDLVVLGGLDVPRLDTLPGYRRLTLAERRQLEVDVAAGLREPLTVPFDEPRVAFLNLPRSRAIGAEATVTAQPVPQLTFQGAYTYTDSEVRSGTRLLRPGDRLPGVPEHQATVTADLFSGPLSVGGTMRYVGSRSTPIDYFSQVLGIRSLPSYTRYDARARVRLSDRLSFSVVGENVTDEQYQDAFGYPGLGRLVRAGVHVAF